MVGIGRLQYKSWKGGEVVRKDIQVGDDTRPFFSISISQKHLCSTVVAGDVVLLQSIYFLIYLINSFQSLPLFNYQPNHALSFILFLCVGWFRC